DAFRWNQHPDGGLFPAGRYLSAAEISGAGSGSGRRQYQGARAALGLRPRAPVARPDAGHDGFLPGTVRGREASPGRRPVARSAASAAAGGKPYHSAGNIPPLIPVGTLMRILHELISDEYVQDTNLWVPNAHWQAELGGLDTLKFFFVVDRVS